MNNQDKKLITACINENAIKLFSTSCEHPLDNDVVSQLKNLNEKLRDDDDDYQIYRHRKIVDQLWGSLLEKAIKCLRFYDTREPFTDKAEKTPIAYGIEDLKKYYEQYSDFERVLYGTGKYYRDHVIHVFRTWLSGVELLTKNDGTCLNHICIAEKDVPSELTPAEKLSVWTLIALTHDLGYPLEKAKSIIDITKKMVSTFISNPDISMDLSFHGVQNYMNDYVVRLMSSKMIPRDEIRRAKKDDDIKPDDDKPYVARLQSKYYFKFQKSLERNKHGILSTLIIYKLLTYFLESDYSINEDYGFSKEDCRQFYIRREILRAIASHTCDDVYQMYMGSFSFLLRICDDTQEWGRKNISELYVKSNQTYELSDIDLKFNEQDKKQNECRITEQIEVSDAASIRDLILRFRNQAIVYITIFRDGQDTANRDFSFYRQLKITTSGVTFALKLNIFQDKASCLSGEISYVSTGATNEPYGKEFFKQLQRDGDLKEYQLTIYDENDANVDNSAPEHWRKGRFVLPLL